MSRSAVGATPWCWWPPPSPPCSCWPAATRLRRPRRLRSRPPQRHRASRSTGRTRPTPISPTMVRVAAHDAASLRHAGAFVANVAAPATSAVATGLSPSTTYSFAVFAHERPQPHLRPSSRPPPRPRGRPARRPGAVRPTEPSPRQPTGPPRGSPQPPTRCAPAPGASIVSSTNQTVAATQIAGSLSISDGKFNITGTAHPNTVARLTLLGGTQAVTSR